MKRAVWSSALAHGWFERVDPDVLYVLMEVRQQTDYAWHHVQNLMAFGAMRRFADSMRARSHRVLYVALEGFIRQIIGWREYMRGIYCAGQDGWHHPRRAAS